MPVLIWLQDIFLFFFKKKARVFPLIFFIRPIKKMKSFYYEDIQLIPELCVVNSRKECDTTVKLGKHTFNLPVAPSNMATVVNEELCEKLAEKNYFYIMHRFNVDQVKFIKHMKSKNLVTSISVGVKPDDFALIETLKKEQLVPDYITIDIAHGHAFSVKKWLNIFAAI